MSGSGKTTIARGLMALLTEQGYTVQPFKCGPDYIDTKFHEAVCGRPSINLDTFMATPEHVRELFNRYGADADICIVEGMMGLFDGYDRDSGSSYAIARELGVPVVLVVDARSAAYSMAALLSGFIHFRKDIRFAGVIYNKVGSARHYAMLQQVCGDLGVPCLGYLPKAAELEQGSRYLGLDFSEKAETRELVRLLEQHVDIHRLMECAAGELETPPRPSCVPSVASGLRPSAATPIPSKARLPVAFPLEGRGAAALRVLVALNDESFSFVYREALDRFSFVYREALEHISRVRFFDPEKDVPDLTDIDMLYLPGGYPEKHLDALVANEGCRRSIRDYAERGGRVVAECGGMMYLCRSIVTDGGEYPMCGVLPYDITARKADRRLSLGYRRFLLDGKEYRGHEFHYTQFLGETPPSVAQVFNAKGEPVETPVFKYKNVLASYTHLYQI